jgi:ArsR family transcriptional regulator
MALSPHNLPLLSRFTTLNDAARLRMLRLLDREELSVGELARSLQLPQSTVSRHLKLLHEGQWVMKRAEGTASLYRLSGEALESEARALWSLARAQLGDSPTFGQDDARLAEVLAERRTDSKSFFGRVGGEWDRLRRELFGESFTAEALLGLVKSETVIADLGCGTGDAAEHLAPFVKKVIAVDREQAMLDAARKRLAGHSNVEFRRGELTDLPLKNGEVDAALVFLVMQHIEEPEPAVAEISRTLKPGGVLLIVDLMSHDRESYRHTMGHRHMGFDERTIKLWARHAGMSDVRYRRLRPDTHARGPALFVATMRK